MNTCYFFCGEGREKWKLLRKIPFVTVAVTFCVRVHGYLACVPCISCVDVFRRD